MSQTAMAGWGAWSQDCDFLKLRLTQRATSPTKSSENNIKAERSTELEAVFDEFDLDDSGYIEFQELLALGKARRITSGRSQWTEVLRSALQNAKLICPSLAGKKSQTRCQAGPRQRWPRLSRGDANNGKRVWNLTSVDGFSVRSESHFACTVVLPGFCLPF